MSFDLALCPNLTMFNLVTHSERRDMLDIVTKYIFGGMLLRCLEAAGYFNCGNTEQGNSSEAEPNDSIDSRVPNDRIAIGWYIRLIMHVIQCCLNNVVYSSC